MAIRHITVVSDEAYAELEEDMGARAQYWDFLLEEINIRALIRYKDFDSRKPGDLYINEFYVSVTTMNEFFAKRASGIK